MNLFLFACWRRAAQLSVVSTLVFGSATLAIAASLPDSADTKGLEQQCDAAMDGDIQRLRRLSKPLQPFGKCPHTVYTLAEIVTENFRQDAWLAFRDLAAPEDRAQLSNMRLGSFIDFAPNQSDVKPVVRGIERI